MLGALSSVAVSPILAATTIPYSTILAEIQSLESQLSTADFNVVGVQDSARQLIDRLRPHDVALERLDRLETLLFESGDPHQYRTELLETVSGIRREVHDNRASSMSGPALVFTLGSMIAGTVIRVAAREFEAELSARLGRSLAILQNRIPVTRLTPAEAVARWENLSVGEGEQWTDIGSGNGASLGRIGQRNRGSVVGIDLESSSPLHFELAAGGEHVVSLPPNVVYKVLGFNPEPLVTEHERLEHVYLGRFQREQTTDERIQEMTLQAVGPEQSHVVSLLFPDPGKRPSRLLRLLQGKPTNKFDFQFRTAIEALEPGGMGFILLAPLNVHEDNALPYSLSLLRGLPEITEIAYCDQFIGVDQLDLSVFKVDTPHAQAELRRTFTEGVPIFFRKASRKGTVS